MGEYEFQRHPGKALPGLPESLLPLRVLCCGALNARWMSQALPVVGRYYETVS